MKKIIYTLLIALLAFAFMGCPTVYEENYDLTVNVGDIIGDFNGDGEAATNNGDGTYTAKFAYKDSMNAWGNGDGKCAFKMRTVAGDWGAPAYGLDDPLVLGADYAECSTTGGNITVEGLVEGKTYTVTFLVVGDKVSVKISE